MGTTGVFFEVFQDLVPHDTMCKMAHFARNAVSSDDLKVALKSANLGDLGRAGKSGR